MLAYAVFVVVLSIARRPAALWKTAKVQGFIKLLGETGTRVFFIIFACAVAGFGIWFLTW